MAIINCPECQKEVSESAFSCPYCGYGVKKHFDDIAFAEQQALRVQQQAERRKERNKMLKIIVPICITTIAICTGLLINGNILSKRTTFKSESEMLEYLTRYKSWELDHKQDDEWLVFHDDGFAESLSNDGLLDGGDTISMNPQRGTFKFNYHEYIVSDTGDIIRTVGERKYYYKPSFSPAPIKSALYDLKLEVLSSKHSADGKFSAEIKVTNKGNRTYNQIYLKTKAMDDAGNFLILDDFELVIPDNVEHSLELSPGQTGTCSIFSLDIDSKYKSFETTIKSYDIPYNIK